MHILRELINDKCKIRSGNFEGCQQRFCNQLDQTKENLNVTVEVGKLEGELELVWHPSYEF